MNKWGIGLGFLLLLLSLASLYLGAEVYSARSKRLAELGDLQNQVQELEATLLEEELAVQAKRTQVVSAQQVWGRYYGAPVTVQNAENGLVELGIGTDAGLGRVESQLGSPLPSVHLYSLSQQRPPQYMGEFRLNGVTNTFATAQLRRSPVPGEAEDWYADGYRIRTKAPPAYGTLISELVTEFGIAQQSLAAEQTALAEVERQARLAQEMIDGRIAQVNGNPAAPEDAPAVIREGLKAVTAQAEARRDDAGTQVSNLRQRYYQLFVEFERQLDQIQRLTSRLPGAENSGASLDLSAGPVRVN